MTDSIYSAAYVIETEACAQIDEKDINWDYAYVFIKADKTCWGLDIKVPV